MIPVRDLFETHLTVRDLKRSMDFYGAVLGFELAHVDRQAGVAFYWIGGRGQSMLGLWKAGASPQRMSLHIAFRADLADVLNAPQRLRSVQIATLDFDREPTDEAIVLAWMPAAAVYFYDPDGHLLELLAMLPDTPRPELGVVRWREWTNR